MKTLKIQAVLLVFLASQLYGQDPTTSQPEKHGISPQRLAILDQTLNTYVKNNQIAGGVALIARRGNIVYLHPFGMSDIEKNKPMTSDAIFRIASMSKAITIAGVMMLFEEGHFTLDDPISKFIPEFKNMKVMIIEKNDSALSAPYKLENAKSQITIRHLLNHTSGIAYFDTNYPYIGDVYRKNNVIYDGLTVAQGTVGDMVKRLAGLPLVNHPGENWRYGFNMDVLGYMIEIISGMPLDKFLSTRIFQPLKMNDTYFYLPDEKVDRLASLYGEFTPGKLQKIEGQIQNKGETYSGNYPYTGPRKFFAGGGGLVSTAVDYYKFLQMLLNKGTSDNKRLLSRKTVELMTSEQVGDMFPWWRGYGFGFGFGIERGPSATGNLGSEGSYQWLGFFDTHFWVDPKEELIGIIMIQLYPRKDIETKFKNAVYQALIN